MKKKSKGKKNMYWTDKHAPPFSLENFADLDLHQDASLDILRPLKVPLTPQERMCAPKMGAKTLEVGEKLLEYLEDNPTLCPPFVKIQEIKAYMQEIQRLRGPILKAEQTYQILFDRSLTARSEVYQRFLGAYEYIRMLAERGDTEAEKAWEELKSRFAHHPKDKKDQQDTPDTLD